MNVWDILTDLPKLTDTKNWNMKHTKPLEAHFLYDVFFHVLTYKRSALGLFLRKGCLQCMCWLCAENLQRRVLKINSVGREGRFRQRKELKCDVIIQKAEFDSLLQEALGLRLELSCLEAKAPEHYMVPPLPSTLPSPTHRSGVSCRKAVIFSLTIYGESLRWGPLAANTASSWETSISVMKVRSGRGPPVSMKTIQKKTAG